MEDKMEEFLKDVHDEILLKGVFVGDIYAKKSFQKEIINRGICCINGYNEERKCFEKCIMNQKQGGLLIPLDISKEIMADCWFSSDVNVNIDELYKEVLSSRKNLEINKFIKTI